jgi:glutathione S-transferase
VDRNNSALAARARVVIFYPLINKESGMPTVVLHQWERSPFCGKVRKVLRHKRIDFSVVNYNGVLGRRATRLSPAGQLPVLDFDGERVQDSSEIVAFLERRVPECPVVPPKPGQRAHALLLEDWADESLYWYLMASLLMGDPIALAEHIDMLCSGRPAWERIPVGIVVRRMYKQKLKAQGLGRLSPSCVQNRLCAHFGLLETLLTEGLWLVGESKSIADIAVSAQIDGMMKISLTSSRVLEYPHLTEWLARCA